MLKTLRFLVLALATIVLSECANAATSPETEFQKLVPEYLEGHLAWRPAFGMSLGLHQYDGRITDFRRASLDAELRRLKEFQARLARIGATEVRS